jgi:hypothetical protein
MTRREESFVAKLNELGDLMRVSFSKDGGAIVRFSVQYEAMIAGELKPVVRYDTAHGFAHRDMLDAVGSTRYWDRMSERPSYRESLSDAIQDIKNNWRRYREDFLRSRERKRDDDGSTSA